MYKNGKIMEMQNKTKIIVVKINQNKWE